MFSEKISEIIDYHEGSPFLVPSNQEPIILEERRKNTLLLSAFMTVQNNCERACESTLLSKLHEIERNKIIENSRVGQSFVKYFETKKSSDYESCVKKCFVERLQKHFGDSEEVKNFIFQTAFEYDQREINHFRLNNFKKMPNSVNMNYSYSDLQKNMMDHFNKEL